MRLLLFVCAWSLLLFGAVPVGSAPTASFTGSKPRVVLWGIGFEVPVALAYPTAPLPAASRLYAEVVLTDATNRTQRLINSSSAVYTEDGLTTSLSLSGVKLHDTGPVTLQVRLSYVADMSGASVTEYPVYCIPGWLSLLPPISVVVVAVVTREVLWALFVGIFVAASIIHQGNVLVAVLRTVDTYVIASMADASHAKVIAFSWCLVGMVAVIQRSGGGQGMARAITRCVTTRRGMQLAIFALGLAVFFDDYANTVLLGNTLRPVADGFLISREKLAFLVDCTAAPIASLVPVSSWIGFEVGLIDEQLKTLREMGYGMVRRGGLGDMGCAARRTHAVHGAPPMGPQSECNARGVEVRGTPPTRGRCSTSSPRSQSGVPLLRGTSVTLESSDTSQRSPVRGLAGVPGSATFFWGGGGGGGCRLVGL